MYVNGIMMRVNNSISLIPNLFVSTFVLHFYLVILTYYIYHRMFQFMNCLLLQLTIHYPDSSAILLDYFL